MRWIARIAAALALALVAASCVADEAGNPARGCDSDGDCLAEQMCYRGFCVLREPDAGFDAGPVQRDSGPGETDGGGDAGGEDAGGEDAGGEDAGDEECSDGTTGTCYTGDAVTRGVGECTDGERTCTSGTWSACEGAVTPVAETCNEADDDCDGSTDEDFSFDSDPMHCGDCSTVCADGTECCGGTCVDTQTDESNCGVCGMSCTPPARRCCSGTCQTSC